MPATQVKISFLADNTTISVANEISFKNFKNAGHA